VERSAHVGQLGVHVHVPFCRTICTYCDCSTEALASPEQLERYLDCLDREMAHTSGLFSRLELERLYVGGGTPNILDARQLQRMLSMIFDRHRFRRDAVLCLESDPRQLTIEKLRVARDHGINRLSFGVQSSDASVLKRVNRGGQTQEMVERSVREALALGFPEVNLDYVYGLSGEALDDFLAGLSWSLTLEPTSLCIQLLNDSHFASPYRDDAHRAEVAAELLELGRRLGDQLDPRYDLHVRPDTLVVTRRDMWRTWDGHLEYYSARDRTPRSTLGYGRHAQSILYGELHYQNQDRTSRFDPSAPVYAAREWPPELECVSDVVAELEFEGAVDLSRLEPLHGQRVTQRVGRALDALARAGHLKHQGSRFVVDGLTGAGVHWLAEKFLPDASRPLSPDGAPEMPHVLLVEPHAKWRIRVEQARSGRRYFRQSAGFGIFYQAEPDVTLDITRTEKIMNAVVSQVERLIAKGVAPELFAEGIALFLQRRVGSLGINVRAVTPEQRRRRLTVVAPG
jgi:coproporphyrinogen III oxidase-like Fe-S oxidoreductase